MSISRHEGNRVDVALTSSPKDVVVKSTPFGALITLDGAAGVGEPGDPALPRAVVRIGQHHPRLPFRGRIALVKG